MGAPVSVLETAGEGGPYGMAILAAYRLESRGRRLPDYLDDVIFAGAKTVALKDSPEDSAGFRAFLMRYQAALALEKAAVAIL